MLTFFAFLLNYAWVSSLSYPTALLLLMRRRWRWVKIFLSLIKNKCFRLTCLWLLHAFAQALIHLMSVWLDNDKVWIKPLHANIKLLERESNASYKYLKYLITSSFLTSPSYYFDNRLNFSDYLWDLSVIGSPWRKE